jgi:hypothetical protein
LVENSGDKRAVCIYNECWEILYHYKDFENIKSVVFIQENELEENMDMIDHDSILYISEYLKRSDVRSLLENRFPGIDRYIVNNSGRGTVLYISD